MRMKSTLLASSALAIVLSAAPAQADGDLYISVLGGANWLDDTSRTIDGGDSSFHFDPDTGFFLGAAFGVRLDNWLKGARLELEASYRRDDVGGAWTTDTGSTGGFIDGNASTFAVMANVWYDIDVGTKFRPYVGGGIGWARSNVDAAIVTTFTDGGPTTDLFSSVDIDSSGFAWQLGIGFNYEIMPDVDVGLGYRYFVGPATEQFFDGDSESKVDNDNHTVFVNLTIGIN